MTAPGLGSDKAKVEIRATANPKVIDPHRLEGNLDEYELK